MNNRIKKILDLISKNKLDAILISSVPNIIYLTNYSGFSYFEREAFLVITKKANYLITDGRYSEAVSNVLSFKLLEISQSQSLSQIFENLKLKKIQKVGFEEDSLTVSEFKSLKKYFKLTPLKDLGNLRILKDEDEISNIESACSIGDKSFEFILGKIKTGVSEKEIAFEIEMFVKKNGAELSFPSIVAFGKNSSIPHHKTGNSKLSKNQIVLLDFGVKLDDYCSDMTRTVFFGRLDSEFKKIYRTVLDAQEKAIELVNSKNKSVKASDIDNIARRYIVSQGFPTIPHSLGHGIGIEVHESPRLSPKGKDILKQGMVFSVEPGIYVPGYGGVRIEDLVYFDETDSHLLTHSPKHLIEI
jgi:Xaa-Pro aminopeptidase